MKLEQIVQGKEALLFMERYVDEAAKTYSPFAAQSEVAPEYQPRGNQPSFEVVSVIVPHERVAVFRGEPANALWNYDVRPEGMLFVVHPETWSSPDLEHRNELHSLPRGEAIGVAPTASTRTVLTVGSAESVPTHFLKLHYPRRISRFNRRLRTTNIRNSVAASRDLASVKLDRFAFLPDVFGFTFGHARDAWGFLVREAIPRPYQAGRFLIPGFALYGGDLKHSDDPPLLVQLIEHLAVEPVSFVIDEIMIPAVECWAKVVRERGILLESHAQNLLLEVDQNFRPCRIVHRDCDVWVDAEVRKRAGLEVPFQGSSLGTDTAFPREQHYSLVYDRFLGCEFFDFLLKILQRFYKADENQIKRQVKDAFHCSFPDSDHFFPARTTYYFSNELLSGTATSFVWWI